MQNYVFTTNIESEILKIINENWHMIQLNMLNIITYYITIIYGSITSIRCQCSTYNIST